MSPRADMRQGDFLVVLFEHPKEHLLVSAEDVPLRRPAPEMVPRIQFQLGYESILFLNF